MKFVAYGRKEYYSDKYNWIDDAHFVMFVVYFFKRFFFLKDILPTDYLYEEFDRSAPEHHKVGAINTAKMNEHGMEIHHIA